MKLVLQHTFFSLIFILLALIAGFFIVFNVLFVAYVVPSGGVM